MEARESHGRSISKAVSWRILGTLDTFLITLLVTGSFRWAGSIASVESISKIILFYLHERAWSKFGWQRERRTDARPVVLIIRRLLRLHFPSLATLPSSSNLPGERSK
jgi:uncharacterized membrane protein